MRCADRGDLRNRQPSLGHKFVNVVIQPDKVAEGSVCGLAAHHLVKHQEHCLSGQTLLDDISRDSGSIIAPLRLMTELISIPLPY